MSNENDGLRERRTARQEAALLLQLEWIRAVDSKTAVVIPIATAMLATLWAVAPKPSDLNLCSVPWLAIGTVPPLLALVFCWKATFPQTDGPAGSFIYFGGICSHDLAKYGEKVRSRTDDEHLEDLCQQVHRNAQIARSKYGAVQHAMKALLAGALLWVAAIYVLNGT